MGKKGQGIREWERAPSGSASGPDAWSRLPARPPQIPHEARARAAFSVLERWAGQSRARPSTLPITRLCTSCLAPSRPLVEVHVLACHYLVVEASLRFSRGPAPARGWFPAQLRAHARGGEVSCSAPEGPWELGFGGVLWGPPFLLSGVVSGGVVGFLQPGEGGEDSSLWFYSAEVDFFVGGNYFSRLLFWCLFGT